ncbi:hypothetical protein [Pelagicoccus sp. SDUM812002]|uniref:hypothetical protein n=1 Tax=Pelagicoccus sp. SDUM812002 TaxID=3041266 RepID=UPI00280D455D|nr:hypothetical protein [Pelagicoccus sp. SDUM812002]MDQ8188594.1 hypothetical protein [Pelagicoccus sp. SDUM812002]
MNILLYLILSLYILSFFGAMFVSSSFWLFGMAGFLSMMVVWIGKHGFKHQKVRLKKLWIFIAPAFVVCFLSYWLLIGSSGGPDLKELSALAKRESYEFLRLCEVSRLRFVSASVVSSLSWHLLACGFCLELIAANKAPQTTRASARV